MAVNFASPSFGRTTSGGGNFGPYVTPTYGAGTVRSVDALDARSRCDSQTGPGTEALSGMEPRGTRFARRASEEHIPSMEIVESRQRTWKRLKSMPDMREENRHDDVQIHPKDQAYLHTLHETLKRSQGESNEFDEKSVITMDKLDDWGSGDSWHVCVQLPLGNRELGFATRSFKVRPKVSEKGAAFLAEQGVGMINTKGFKGQDMSVGQDACSLSRLTSGWEVFCLMDGHGHQGHWPANHSTRTMPYVLQNNPGCVTMLKQGQASAALHHAFEKVQSNLVYESLAKDMELQVAGCTGLCILMHEQQNAVWVATAGDTRALLLCPGRGVLAQTIDHKPSLEGERERLESMGCDIVRTEHEDGFVEERVNIQGQDFPGLCMSRSLGDLAVKEHGVTHDPDVVEWNLEGLEKAYILACSDGVWEFLKNDDVGEFVLAELESGASYHEVCEQLLHKARESWEKFEDQYCDDITIILAPIVRNRPLARVGCLGGCFMGLRRMFGCGGVKGKTA
mmetsp:Transcript_175890/g.558785  ORF Transcript_175890/g.558785 Transcript_175890/m.558785 type:complete len:509 (-) Transcript_175890:69-1595(-)